MNKPKYGVAQGGQDGAQKTNWRHFVFSNRLYWSLFEIVYWCTEGTGGFVLILLQPCASLKDLIKAPTPKRE